MIYPVSRMHLHSRTRVPILPPTPQLPAQLERGLRRRRPLPSPYPLPQEQLQSQTITPTPQRQRQNDLHDLRKTHLLPHRLPDLPHLRRLLL